MSKQINFEYQGKPYCLEYTKQSVRQMERNGFVASELVEKPMSMLPQLFAGAFLAHHRYIKPALIEEIFEAMGDRQELVGKLSEMYNEPLEAMMNGENSDDESKNVKWTASW